MRKNNNQNTLRKRENTQFIKYINTVYIYVYHPNCVFIELQRKP